MDQLARILLFVGGITIVLSILVVIYGVWDQWERRTRHLVNPDFGGPKNVRIQYDDGEFEPVTCRFDGSTAEDYRVRLWAITSQGRPGHKPVAIWVGSMPPNTSIYWEYTNYPVFIRES